MALSPVAVDVPQELVDVLADFLGEHVGRQGLVDVGLVAKLLVALG
jgi:hypothetical protein